MQGQGIRFRAVVLLGCHHLHSPKVTQDFVQGHDAGRLVTIVVGDQNVHAVSLMKLDCMIVAKLEETACARLAM